MITGIDHVALAVRDLDAAVAAYGALLGRSPEWVGGDGGARHAWFQLANMALDVIAPAGDAAEKAAGAFGATIRRHLDKHGEGVWAFAFTVADGEAMHRLVTRRGLRATPPTSSRSTHLNGRKRYWTTSAVQPDDTAGVQILLVDPPRDGRAFPLSPPLADDEASIGELDHVVIRTDDPDRAVAIYGGRLGLDLRLDRANPRWGARQLFFRCGTGVVEFAAPIEPPASLADDRITGLAWRTADANAARARIAAAGFDASEVRDGRKPGTRVFTVRSGIVAGPALVIEQGTATQG